MAAARMEASDSMVAEMPIKLLRVKTHQLKSVKFTSCYLVVYFIKT